MDFGLTYVSAVLGCMQWLVSWEVDEGGGVLGMGMGMRMGMGMMKGDMDVL